MIEFPQRAALKSRISLTALKQWGIPPRICSRVKTLVWAYKLSPSTFNLAATDAVDAKIREGKLTDAEVEATLKESFADLADFRLRLDAKRTEWIRGNLFK